MAKSTYRLAKGLHSIHLQVNIYNIELCEKENKYQYKTLNTFLPKLIRQTNLVIGGNGLPFLIELSFLFWPLQIPANGSEQKMGSI